MCREPLDIAQPMRVKSMLWISRAGGAGPEPRMHTYIGVAPTRCENLLLHAPLAIAVGASPSTVRAVGTANLALNMRSGEPYWRLVVEDSGTQVVLHDTQGRRSCNAGRRMSQHECRSGVSCINLCTYRGNGRWKPRQHIGDGPTSLVVSSCRLARARCCGGGAQKGMQSLGIRSLKASQCQWYNKHVPNSA